MNFSLYYADSLGNPGNCSYPHRIIVADEDSLRKATAHDYVCAEYRNHYRSGENFLGADCLPVDCDNDHSDNPEDWVTPDDIRDAFPAVSFAVHYSRSHMKEKNGKAARPKFHVLFPIDPVTDAAVYSSMKKKVNELFPYFDTKALDAARFFFGTSLPEVEVYEGSITLTQYLDELAFENNFEDRCTREIIPEGSRNATLSRFAGQIIKKYGDSERAYMCFLKKADKCVPHLPEDELASIWHSAQKFYAKVQQQSGYVPPDVWGESYKPSDYTDVGQAEILSHHFANELRYSPATGYIRYIGHYWQESEPGAQAVAHELTRRQLEEATADFMDAYQKLVESGGQEILNNTSKQKAESIMSDDQLEAYRACVAAQNYQNFVLGRRDSKKITAALKEARPMLEIAPRDLDSDPFLLCTPDATYDLRKGLAGAREHSPDDFITKITSVSPDRKGEKLWLDCLDRIFCGDRELIDYVQKICGLAVIGNFC